MFSDSPEGSAGDTVKLSATPEARVAVFAAMATFCIYVAVGTVYVNPDTEALIAMLSAAVALPPAFFAVTV